MNEPTIKALSIRQPWAWLVANGHKDIENRNWKTQYRGPFLVHAAKAWGASERDDLLYAKIIAERHGLRIQWPETFDLGGIVGVATIVQCVVGWPSPWFFGEFGFVLTDARPVQFTTCRGMLNFFTPNVPFGAEARWR